MLSVFLRDGTMQKSTGFFPGFLGEALIEHYEKVHKQSFKDEKANVTG